MTRWFPGIGRRPALRLTRMALVVPGNSGLPFAQQERDYLRSLATDQRRAKHGKIVGRNNLGPDAF